MCMVPKNPLNGPLSSTRIRLFTQVKCQSGLRSQTMHTCSLRKLHPLPSKACTIQTTTSTFPLFKVQVTEDHIPTWYMSFLLLLLKKDPPTLMQPSRRTLPVWESWRTNPPWKEEKLNTYRSSHSDKIKRPEKFSGLFFISSFQILLEENTYPFY